MAVGSEACPEGGEGACPWARAGGALCAAAAAGPGRGHGALDRARRAGYRRLRGHRGGRGAGSGAARHEGGGVRS